MIEESCGSQISVEEHALLHTETTHIQNSCGRHNTKITTLIINQGVGDLFSELYENNLNTKYVQFCCKMVIRQVSVLMH